jgi:putative MATE family efflux protein
MELSPKRNQGTLKQVIKTSFPAVIDLTSQTVTWLIEAIFIGQLSALALAGVGVAQQFVILTFSVLLTFIVGSSIVIVRYLGAGDSWNANHVLAQALLIGIILSVFIGLFWYFLVPLLFHLIKEEGDVARDYGVIYIKTTACFAPFIVTNFIALGILRGVGDTLLTMTISLIVNSINVILDVLLIFGCFGFPRLETFGAALAVGIAHTTGFIITIVFLRNRKASLFLAMVEISSPKLSTFKNLFKIGLPTNIEQFVWSIGQLVLSFFAARININALAAHQVMVRIQSALAMVNWGFAVAGMTLVGKNIGANELNEARKSGQLVVLVSALVAFVLTVFIWLLDDHIFKAFTSNRDVIILCKSILIFFLFLQLPKTMNTSYAGNLRGALDLNWLMWLVVVAVIMNEIIGAYILTFVFGLGLAGLWLIQIIDESGRLVLNYWRFNKGCWK